MVLNPEAVRDPRAEIVLTDETVDAMIYEAIVDITGSLPAAQLGRELTRFQLTPQEFIEEARTEETINAAPVIWESMTVDNESGEIKYDPLDALKNMARGLREKVSNETLGSRVKYYLQYFKERVKDSSSRSWLNHGVLSWVVARDLGQRYGGDLPIEEVLKSELFSLDYVKLQAELVFQGPNVIPTINRLRSLGGEISQTVEQESLYAKLHMVEASLWGKGIVNQLPLLADAFKKYLDSDLASLPLAERFLKDKGLAQLTIIT